ncbi:hypothetical protein SAMD00019534_021360 [Acytostelium subglobosum LB1]|nr:hypothetical protein SAMD00019534_021360 [Acytostelium subglobosum LB1]GAM18961.1 hypothetical protein SAMD00019534_021360 [Acytostelium subglobosum LB1]|eukprot:XP_012758181.1 hypothetical protein SAMD00019534_021360 [Acytostelium subglobosum LB1]
MNEVEEMKEEEVEVVVMVAWSNMIDLNDDEVIDLMVESLTNFDDVDGVI